MNAGERDGEEEGEPERERERAGRPGVMCVCVLGHGSEHFFTTGLIYIDRKQSI